jgi:serine/threonine protein kinase
VELSDSVVEHLRRVVDLPDLSGTRYEMEGEIGRGGMGVVYRARDRELGRPVALKVMDGALAEEARVIAQLEHPSIVPVYESGTLNDGRVFYAMKLVQGARLDHFVEGKASLGERLRVIERVGEALGYAHSCGVLHRDLKPQNVMVGAFGEVYVMDWGVAGVAGTEGFRAPEGGFDRRSDVYSLGAVMRFAIGPAAPRALQAVVAKAMSEVAAARYRDAGAMLEEIWRFQEGLAVEAYRESAWERLRRWSARNAVLLWMLAAYVGVRLFLMLLRYFG